MTESPEPLLRVRGLKTTFKVGRSLGRSRSLQAVADVSFDLEQGTTLGIVGESGSGKSTLARTIIGLEKANSGSVLFDGTEVVGASSAVRRGVVRDIQMVFQDPMASLNPRLTAAQAVAEAWVVQPGVVPRSQMRERAIELLERVGLNPDHADRLPHQFSGGQRQRIGIARAIALRPKLIICDEAVSALDVSVQAQILNLLVDLQKEFGLTYLFIAHDLGVVRYVSDQVLVMYLGAPVEFGPASDVFEAPQHPYTQALLSAIPAVRPWDQPMAQQIVLNSDLPSPLNPPTGCAFRTRCWRAEDICATERPPLEPTDGASETHRVACYLPGPDRSAPDLDPVPQGTRP